jgi:hypothetical protein
MRCRTGAFLLTLAAGIWSTPLTLQAAGPPVFPWQRREAEAAKQLEQIKAEVTRSTSLWGKPVLFVDLPPWCAKARHFELLAAFTHLRGLSVKFDRGGSIGRYDLDPLLVHVRQLGSLERLNLGPGNVTDAGLANLAALHKLRLFAVRRGVTDAGLKHLRELKELRELYYLSATLRGDGLKYLAKLSKLEHLYLDRSTITPTSLASLPPLPGLTRLSLWRSSVADEHLANLGRLPALRGLFLDETAVTGRTLPHLVRLPKLCALSMKGTQLDDKGCLGLRDLARLEHLNLAETQISDASIPLLVRLTKLRSLDITGTKITREGLKRLKKALPKTDISHSFE